MLEFKIEKSSLCSLPSIVVIIISTEEKMRRDAFGMLGMGEAALLGPRRFGKNALYEKDLKIGAL